ncbi:S8/S53 family peptidase [Candidatus Fermentibacteria bacterium]|nr:S8/S53 family peptidase [Candidatus Fermentibacteria bacterium]
MRTQIAFLILAALSVLCTMQSTGWCQGGECDIDTVTINGNEVVYVQGQLLVKPLPGMDVRKIADELNASVSDSIPRIGWYRLMLPPNVDAAAEVQEVASLPSVEACELHGVVRQAADDLGGSAVDGDRLNCPPDPWEEIQWPLTITRAVDAWSQVPSNSDVLISILDSGCDTDHPEYASSPRIQYGWNWYTPLGGWPEDYSGHGTHRVGELMAPSGNGGVAGINQNCQVRVEKVTDDCSGLSFRWSPWAVAGALDYVVFEEGSRVVSISLYNATPGYDGMSAMRAAFCDVNDNAPGTVILCCAGNDGPGVKIHYPAAWSCSLQCVIAVGGSTEDDEVWPSTQFQSGDYGGQLSLLSPGENSGSYCSTGLDGGYDADCGGTSGATAHAAGIAGMLISKHPWMVNHQIKTQLQNTSIMIPPPSGYAYDTSDCWGHPCWCIRMGSGRIDAVGALNLRYRRQCPSFRVQAAEEDFEVGLSSSGTLAHGEVSVYDLLGRKLYSQVTSNWPTNRVSATRWLQRFEDVPTGPKIVRVVTPHEVRTWRVVP